MNEYIVEVKIKGIEKHLIYANSKEEAIEKVKNVEEDPDKTLQAQEIEYIDDTFKATLED